MIIAQANDHNKVHKTCKLYSFAEQMMFVRRCWKLKSNTRIATSSKRVLWTKAAKQFVAAALDKPIVSCDAFLQVKTYPWIYF